MKISAKYLFVLISIVLGVIFFISSNTLQSKPDSVMARKAPQAHTRLDVQPVDMVWNADFCGEKVKLDDLEVYERFDRELMVNTYLQSSTLLYLKLSRRWFPIIEPILARNNICFDPTVQFLPLTIVSFSYRQIL